MTLWNLLVVVELILTAVLMTGLIWVYRSFTRRYRDQRKPPTTDRS